MITDAKQLQQAEYNRRYRLKNEVRFLALRRKVNATYSAKHPDRIRAASARYAAANRAANNAKATRYKLAKARRVPPWADLKAIRLFYRDCPVGHHVDHIIPLRGDTVSGLHTCANLQYLPQVANIKKSNKFSC